MAGRTLATSCSKGNSGVCTPIRTNPWSSYFSAQARTHGSVRIQLMHVYVPKSARTTLSFRSASVSGSELSQPVAPSKPGRWPSPRPASRNVPNKLTSLLRADRGHGLHDHVGHGLRLGDHDHV